MYLSRVDLCNYLRINNYDPRILQKFICSPTYPAIHHTLCGVNFNAKWTRTLGRKHLEMIRKNFCKLAQVWQNFFQTRIMPGEHTSKCMLSRVCLIYFLTGKLANIGQLMLNEKARTKFGHKTKRFFFGNILTKYMLS